jgi:two-component sensor histidine kinase
VETRGAISGESWMRGITPLRLAVLAAVCIMFAARPVLWNFDPENLYRSMRALVRTSMVYFVCALPLFVLVVKTEIRTAGSSLRVRIAALVLAVAVGALAVPAGNAALRTLDGNFTSTQLQAWQSWHYLLAFYIRGLSTGALLAAILLFAAHERDAQRRLHQTRLARTEIERQAEESRLRLLQAQIEPHFLFNSLASVKRLYEKEPGNGRALLRDLGAYLRAATRGGRQREVPLGEEIALARSFLAIFQVRMGRRLRVRIDVPPDLELALIPPLMLGTLVENAIKHGIGPRADGGTLTLAARRRGDALEMEVGDDGVGFRARTGHGVGLANTRARLETLFGGGGDLELAANATGGVTAVIRVPLRTAMQPLLVP